MVLWDDDEAAVVLTISYTPTEATRALGELRDAAALLWLVARGAPNGQRRPILNARNRLVRISADLAELLRIKGSTTEID